MHPQTETIDRWADLADLVSHYGSCAETSANLRSYQTACTMLGARLEAALFAAVRLAEGDNAFSGRVPGIGAADLGWLIPAGRRLGWLPGPGDGSNPLAVMSYGLPPVGELLDGTSWRFDSVPPVGGAPYPAAVTEDVYRDCRRYCREVLENVSAFLRLKREDPLIGQHGGRLLRAFARGNDPEGDAGADDELIF